jgi:hypothetical protein
MHTQDQGNNETISRGVFPMNGGTLWCAMTFSESKRFTTKAGAERWLLRRGYDANGKPVSDWAPLTVAQAAAANRRATSRKCQGRDSYRLIFARNASFGLVPVDAFSAAFANCLNSHGRRTNLEGDRGNDSKLVMGLAVQALYRGAAGILLHALRRRTRLPVLE